ncbi:hypothetical protein MPC1_2460002 [Methylocella tundrae]|nr:hypothetical protein MPC1_2460002 [Methylocella tundrae]
MAAPGTVWEKIFRDKRPRFNGMKSSGLSNACVIRPTLAMKSWHLPFESTNVLRAPEGAINHKSRAGSASPVL